MNDGLAKRAVPSIARAFLWPLCLIVGLAGCAEPQEPDASEAAAEEASATALTMVMHHDPNCGCCSDWADYMREQGFELDIRLSDDIVQKRRDLGVPDRFASCHTAEIDGYLVEGHVPADAVLRLLEERPDALGISAPGMPWGSPGMEVGERVDTYPVVLFDADGNYALYARYHGHEAL